jgi:hypothetical protein
MEVISAETAKKVVRLYYNDVPVSDIIKGNKSFQQSESPISRNLEPQPPQQRNRPVIEGREGLKMNDNVFKPKRFHSPPKPGREEARRLLSEEERHKPPPPYKKLDKDKLPVENTRGVIGKRNENPPKQNYYQSEKPFLMSLLKTNNQSRIGAKLDLDPKQQRSPPRHFVDQNKSIPEGRRLNQHSPSFSSKPSAENRNNIREECQKSNSEVSSKARSQNIAVHTEITRMNNKDISKPAICNKVADNPVKPIAYESIDRQKLTNLKDVNSVQVDLDKAVTNKELPKKTGSKEISNLKRKSIPKNCFVKVRATEIISPSEFYIFNEDNVGLLNEIESILSEKNLPPFLTRRGNSVLVLFK